MSSVLERLIPPGMQIVSPTEALNRLSAFIGQVPDLEGVLLVGREGDTQTAWCRPTPGLPDSRIREFLKAAIVRGDKTQPDEEVERLIQIPGMRHLSLREAKQRINSFIEKAPGLTLVMVLASKANLDNLRRMHSGNLSPEAARAMIRRALILFDQRGLPPPAA